MHREGSTSTLCGGDASLALNNSNSNRNSNNSSSPFQRSKSRSMVYFESDLLGEGTGPGPTTPATTTTTTATTPTTTPKNSNFTTNNTTTTTANSNSGSFLGSLPSWARRSATSYVTDLTGIREDAERSSGEESPVSPGGSFRFSRSSPSHKSQDSGFSDSGESNIGSSPEIAVVASSATLKNTNITTTANNKTYLFSSTPSSSVDGVRKKIGPLLRLKQHLRNTSGISSVATSSTTTTSAVRGDDVDEIACQLEHKAILYSSATGTTTTTTTTTTNSKSAEILSPPSPTPSGWSPPCSSTPKKKRGETSVDTNNNTSNQKTLPSSSTPTDPCLVAFRSHQKPSQSTRPKTRRWSSHEDRFSHSWSGQEEFFGEGKRRREDSGGWSREERAAINKYTSLPRNNKSKKTGLQRLVPHFDSNNPVHVWLRDLSSRSEAECLHTLQSKAIMVHTTPFPTDTQETIRAIQQQAHRVSTEFAKLCQRLEFRFVEQVPPLVQSLAGHIQEFVGEYNCRRPEARSQDSCLSRQQRALLTTCQRLRDCPGGASGLALLVREVTALGHAFTALVDLMLSREVKVLLEAVEEATPTSLPDLKLALHSLAALGLDGDHLCRLISREGGVRALLELSLEPRLRPARPLALRALATVCCVSDSIRQLEKAGGVEVLSDILCDLASDAEELSEAAGVLAQITSPWIDNNHRIQDLDRHVVSLVHALTNLAGSTSSTETFLLAAAALANLTFMEGLAASALCSSGTIRVLVQAVRASPHTSVFLQDQVATVLANLSAVPDCRTDVVCNHGMVALLCFLQQRPSPLQRAAEIAACERVQQKAAIALSRLCCDPDVAHMVVELQGVERLVRLCKDERERNHSDGVLVACLAALRKIATTCGLDAIKELDAVELVEPRLLDSFLIYSSRQESYV